MPELADIINELPPELATDGSAVDDTEVEEQEVAEVEEQEAEEQETDEEADDKDKGGDDDDEEDDYFTELEEEEPPKPAAAQTDEGQYILSKLPKISVNVVVPKADGSEGDEIRQFQVYGWGDLPRNMKGFATPYEQGVFTESAQNNELRARELQREYQQDKVKTDTDAYVKRENRMIAEDLSELRQEGIFPKFKGVPGTKEFNESAGGKEFDRVVAFMDAENEKYGRAAQQGKAFRHIGFREAFVMLNGPNTKQAQQKDMSTRRQAAAKLKSSRGTKSNDRVVSNRRVSNLTELADDFANFIGSPS